MLDELPFFPRRIEVRRRLLLIPSCHHRSVWVEVSRRSDSRHSFLGAELFHFDGFTVLTGFMGYPHLLTLLAGLDGWKEKTLFFLGTAGVLDDGDLPDIVCASSVAISPELVFGFSGEELSMATAEGLMPKRVVTVDLPHRESSDWLRRVREEGLERVEMELYPLRYLYGRPFRALLVGSDRVGKGFAPLRRKLLEERFAEAFEMIMEMLNEEQSHPVPPVF